MGEKSISGNARDFVAHQASFAVFDGAHPIDFESISFQTTVIYQSMKLITMHNGRLNNHIFSISAIPQKHQSSGIPDSTSFAHRKAPTNKG